MSSTVLWETWDQRVPPQVRILPVSEVRDLLARIPQYADLGAEDIQLREILLHELLPLQRVLLPRKFPRAHEVITWHRRFKFPLFTPFYAPVVCPNPLLPPIVEIHQDRPILLDGHHRLYALCDDLVTRDQDLTMRVIAITGVKDPLPAAPPFASMGQWMRQVVVDEELYRSGQGARYDALDLTHWRPLSLLRGNCRD